MIKRVLSTWPHALRALAMAAAALSVAWQIALPGGVLAAVAGAAAGVVVGQLLGRSSLRLWAALAGLAAAVVLALALARFAVDSPLLPARFGPGATLRAATILRFGAVMLGVTAAARVVAVRRPVAVGVELAMVAIAIPLSFAAHRDGVIARPLWVSDWAWQRGIDPTEILLAIGGGAVAVLALLLLAEGRSRRALSAFFSLGTLIVAAILLLRHIGIPTPDPLADLGLDGGADGGGDGGRSDAGDGGPEGPPPRGDGDAGADQDGGGAEAEGSRDGGDAEGSRDGGDTDGGGIDVPPDLERASSGGKDAPMAIVLLDDDYSSPSQGYYFREGTFSEFNGTRLVHTSRADVDLDVPESFPSQATPVPDAPPATGRALVHTTVVLLVDHPHPFALESPSLLAPAQNPNPARFKRAYRATSLAQSGSYKELFGHPAGNPAWPAAVRDYYLVGPEDPRYAALARDIVSKLPAGRRSDPFAKAVAVKLRLDDAFIYSTKHRHAGVVDPTADFLFGDRTGYCVHFAHAAVYLWRALGIPARVATGYRPDEDGRRGGSAILVRGADAHAWPELYLEGYGWVILDIAPKTNLDPPSPGVDADLQRLLGEMARSLPADPEETSGTPSSQGHLLRDVGRGALALLALGIALLYAVKIWRRVIPFLAPGSALPRVGYRSMLDMLGEVGQRRRFGEGREAFARRVRSIAPSFEALTAMHLAAALGSPARDRASRKELSRTAWRDGLSAVRREVRAASPPWRRALGALDPASFLGSR